MTVLFRRLPLLTCRRREDLLTQSRDFFLFHREVSAAERVMENKLRENQTLFVRRGMVDTLPGVMLVVFVHTSVNLGAQQQLASLFGF